jgi:hypothetical protein
MFERSRELLEQYYCRVLTQGMSRRAEHLLHELRGRLRAVQWLHTRLLELDREIEREARSELPVDSRVPDVLKVIFTDATRPDCQSYSHATLPFSRSDELRLLLETFYYSAHRIRDVLRDSGADLPGLAKFEAAAAAPRYRPARSVRGVPRVPGREPSLRRGAHRNRGPRC